LNLFRGKAMEVLDQDSLCLEHNTATWAVPNRFSRSLLMARMRSN
jgi:hypothetical protein